jgi:hypothetical protein
MLLDLHGKKFGRLTVLRRAGVKSRFAMWLSLGRRTYASMCEVPQSQICRGGCSIDGPDGWQAVRPPSRHPARRQPAEFLWRREPRAVDVPMFVWKSQRHCRRLLAAPPRREIVRPLPPAEVTAVGSIEACGRAHSAGSREAPPCRAPAPSKRPKPRRRVPASAPFADYLRSILSYGRAP